MFGFLRPSIYMAETGTFFSTARLDIKKKEIEPRESEVLRIILESPSGFGEHLKKGAVLSVRNGLDEIGRALVLEIEGYWEDLNSL